MQSHHVSLTASQRREAEQQEKIVDDGLSTYVEVGLALRKIQDERLHEGRFIDYAMDRFALKPHTIYRLIRAAVVAKTLVEAGLPCPKNAGQAHRIHELAKDDPSDQIVLWEKVMESGLPATLSQIDQVAKEESETTSKPEVEGEVAGEVGMNSVHHVEPVCFPPSDADPLPCLYRAAQELRAVSNAIDEGFDELESLEEGVEVIGQLLDGIRCKLQAVCTVV